MIGRIVRLLKRLFTVKSVKVKCNGTLIDEVGYDPMTKNLMTQGYYCRYEGLICFSDMVAYDPNTRSLIYVVEDTGEGQSCPSVYALSYDPVTKYMNYLYYSSTCLPPIIQVEEVIGMSSQASHVIVSKAWETFMEEWI